MKKKNLLETIHSKYILDTIFKYIKEEKIFKMDLFAYSIYFQKKLNLNLFDYQEEFLKLNGIHFYNYLYNINIEKGESDMQNFDKEIIKTNLKRELSKYNIDLNIIEKINQEYFQKYIKEIKEKIFNDNKNKKKKYSINKEFSEIKIEIYSPLFNTLSKNKIFENCTIIIPIYNIELYKLKDDYLYAFDKLNKSKIKYLNVAIYYKDFFDLQLVNDLKLNFNSLKELTIKNISSDISTSNLDNNFLNSLFSLNPNTNLLYFNLDMGDYSFKIDPISLINLSNFKSLENLSLKNIEFIQFFTLELNNIKNLKIIFCSKIAFSEKLCLTLKKLYVYDSFIKFPSNLFKFKQIEECHLINNERNHNNYFSKIIDFASFDNLKILTVEDIDFLHLNNKSLERVKIYRNIFRKIINKNRNNQVIIEKLLSLKSLKEIDIEFGVPPSFDDMLKINGQNNSINKIILSCFNRKDLLNNLINKLPNLSEIELVIYSFNNDLENTSLKIIENSNYKINKISLEIIGNINFICFCEKFKHLESFNIKTKNEIINKNQIIPIFNDNCDTIFENLIFFKFIYLGIDGINYDTLNNLYNNINKIPNLKYFELKCYTDINENFYKQFIEKFLSLKLDKLIIIMEKFISNDNENDSNDYQDLNNLYTRVELKILFPKIKYIDINKVFIRKYPI